MQAAHVPPIYRARQNAHLDDSLGLNVNLVKLVNGLQPNEHFLIDKLHGDILQHSIKSALLMFKMLAGSCTQS